jgi:glycosyltransferase involved in cell wall biosynthesis
LRNYLYLHLAMPLFCRRATALIAVSEATKRDLGELYGIASDRIHVIPEAAAPRFRPVSADRAARVRQRYGLPARFVLAVGTLEPRKNLTRLVHACESLFAEDAVDALVLVGGRGWLDSDFYRMLDDSPWKGRVMLPGYIADDDLPAVYAAASVTALPSLYEGFGLPVLEAMACGSPVCTSNASSLPEVAGDAALYFDPLDVEQMTAQLRRVVSDEALAKDLGERGLARASLFSWDRVARETLAVYGRVLGRTLVNAIECSQHDAPLDPRTVPAQADGA